MDDNKIDVYALIDVANLEMADIASLEDMVIASGDAFNMYHFALGVKNIDIKKIEDAIIATGNACYIYLFAKNIEGADVLKLEDAIIRTRNIEYMYYFFNNVKNIEEEKLKYEIAKIIKKEKNVRESYFSVEEITSPRIFSYACQEAIEYNRQNYAGKQKTKHQSWL